MVSTSTTTLLAIMVVLLSSVLLVAAQEPIDVYCQNVGIRGGCASCEAALECSWCAKPRANYDAVCVAASTCEDRLDGYTLSATTGQLCPADPLAFQAPVRDFEFSPNSEKKVKDNYRFTTFHDENFCGLGFKFPFDRSAHSQFHVDDASIPDDLCYYANNNYGFPMMTLLQGKGRKRDIEPLEYYGQSIRTKAELIESVANYCDGPNPYTTEQGVECVRLMKQAYCTVGCSDYYSAQGSPCSDSDNFMELTRVCADYFDSEIVDGKFCVLDPLNLIKIFPVGGVAPSACDPELDTIKETTTFQDAFGIFEPLVAVTEEEPIIVIIEPTLEN